jgi:hypothetical protein
MLQSELLLSQHAFPKNVELVDPLQHFSVLRHPKSPLPAPVPVPDPIVINGHGTEY